MAVPTIPLRDRQVTRLSSHRRQAERGRPRLTRDLYGSLMSENINASRILMSVGALDAPTSPDSGPNRARPTREHAWAVAIVAGVVDIGSFGSMSPPGR